EDPEDPWWLRTDPELLRGGLHTLRTGTLAQAVGSYGSWSDRPALVSGPPRMILSPVRPLTRIGTPAGHIAYDPYCPAAPRRRAAPAVDPRVRAADPPSGPHTVPMRRSSLAAAAAAALSAAVFTAACGGSSVPQSEADSTGISTSGVGTVTATPDT